MIIRDYGVPQEKARAKVSGLLDRFPAVPLVRGECLKAVEIAYRYGVSVFDALVVAAAS